MTSLEQLMAALKAQAGGRDKGPPPVDQWNPPYCGEAGFEILADGTWKHEGTRITRESLVKLFACRAAEWVTREALQIHGGMGYAEEMPVSRYFVDARVLSIFEGAEETLALKVIARDLIAGAAA